MTGVNANNYRYIRYAHVILWRAEVAAFERDLGKARELVNLIRERAGNEVVMGKVLIHHFLILYIHGFSILLMMII